MGGIFLEKDNFTPANSLQTPVDIVPLWYFTPYYSILRANTINFFWIPAKFWGVFFMGWSILALFLIPWLDRSPVKSIRYRSYPFKLAITLFVIAFVILGYLGMQPVSPGRTIVAQLCTIVYFAFFILMPFYTRWGTPKPVPERLTFK